MKNSSSKPAIDALCGLGYTAYQIEHKDDPSIVVSGQVRGWAGYEAFRNRHTPKKDEYTLDLFAQAPQSCRVGDRFTVGTTQLEFRVERIDGNRCIVRGESRRKRILPREYVEVRCTTARINRMA